MSNTAPLELNKACERKSSLVFLRTWLCTSVNGWASGVSVCESERKESKVEFYMCKSKKKTTQKKPHLLRETWVTVPWAFIRFLFICSFHCTVRTQRCENGLWGGVGEDEGEHWGISSGEGGAIIKSRDWKKRLRGEVCCGGRTDGCTGVGVLDLLLTQLEEHHQLCCSASSFPESFLDFHSLIPVGDLSLCLAFWLCVSGGSWGGVGGYSFLFI